MMHVNNGLYVEKLAAGAVRILKKHGNEVVLDETIPSHIWGSIIASMSYYGEEDYGWYRAMHFHVKQPLDETSPLIDKPGPDQ